MMKKSIINSDDAKVLNFREILMGSIAPGMLYRSSHPIKANKQETAIALMANNAKIAAVINLHNTNSEVYAQAPFAPWYNFLLERNRIIALGMDFSITSESFKRKLKKGLQFIINTEGPWLIHCYGGVDRTGFVSIVLESFMGAALDDVINDYLQSFNSMFESSIHETHKADSLSAIRIISVMSDSIAVNDQNLQYISENYVQKTIGLSSEEAELLKRKLAGEQYYRKPIGAS